jgi:hypothetical protein
MGIVNGLGIRSFSSVKVKVLLRELHRDHHPRFFLHAQGGKYCNLYKANMPGLKYGSCRFGKSNSHSNVFQIRRSSVCVPSRWKVLSGEFRRRPTALAIKLRKSDRVGRRGLPEPREDFSRLTTYAWTQKWFVQDLAAD